MRVMLKELVVEPHFGFGVVSVLVGIAFIGGFTLGFSL